MGLSEREVDSKINVVVHETAKADDATNSHAYQPPELLEKALPFSFVEDIKDASPDFKAALRCKEENEITCCLGKLRKDTCLVAGDDDEE